ncbi:MAG: hypothetical protein AB8B72_12605 [Crocinitomicaceae bacterium]
MKRAFTIAGVLLIGIFVGILLAQNMAPIERLKIVKEQIVDTVYQSQIVEVPVETKIRTIDTVFIETSLDTAVIGESEENDSVPEVLNTNNIDSLTVKRDEKLYTETLDIKVLKSGSVDSLQSILLDVEPVNLSQVLVEYWESPINFKGYKLSKTKLIIYGLTPLKESMIYKYGNIFYLEVGNLFYELEETSSFKSLLSSSKPEFIND